MIHKENGKTTITCDKCKMSSTASSTIANEVFYSEAWRVNSKGKYKHVCYACTSKESKHMKVDDWDEELYNAYVHNILEYNGYKGEVKVCFDDNILYGRLIGITDLVSFHSNSFKGIRIAFAEAVNSYIETLEIVEEMFKEKQ
jgi:hypothetical protein